VQDLQGKAERVKPATLSDLLQECYRERLAIYDRHVRGAQSISDYEFNNAYQYIIARDETHLSWLRAAIMDLGGSVPKDFQPLDVPQSGRGDARQRAVIEDDARVQQAFVDRWRPRVEGLEHARHRNMLKVMLGEMLEHRRLFDDALAGRDDLLGRRPPGASTGDGVLPVRWIE
jgi:hypothetical protein